MYSQYIRLELVISNTFIAEAAAGGHLAKYCLWIEEIMVRI